MTEWEQLRRLTLLPLILLVAVSAQAQTKHKYRITGYAPLNEGGDCTHPALIAYGYDRIDAALSRNINPLAPGLTVWTESEWESMRKNYGKEFDAECAKSYPKKKAKP